MIPSAPPTFSLELSSPLNPLGFQLIDIEKLKQAPLPKSHSPFVPHRLDFYCILLISRGSGTHFFEFEQFMYNAPCFLYIRKNNIHAFSQLPEAGTGILFSEAWLRHVSLLSDHLACLNWELLGDPVFPVPEADLALLQQKIALIHSETKTEKSAARDDRLRLAFGSLLLQFKDYMTQSVASISQGDRETFERFEQLMDTHIASMRNALDYSDALGVTYKSLNRLCKTLVRKTAKECIDDYLLMRIKHALLADDTPIQIISDKFGFDEQTNFVKYFKRKIGMTPSKFRKTRQH